MRLNSNIQNHDHNQNLFSLPQTNHTFKKLLFTYAPNLLFFFQGCRKVRIQAQLEKSQESMLSVF